MLKIKLMADYGCDPLWWIEGDKVGNIDLETLPISQELIQKLREWATIYSNTLNWDDPTNSLGFTREKDRDKFDQQGYQLAKELERQLGNKYEIVYFSEKSNKLTSLSDFYDLLIKYQENKFPQERSLFDYIFADYSTLNILKNSKSIIIQIRQSISSITCFDFKEMNRIESIDFNKKLTQ